VARVVRSTVEGASTGPPRNTVEGGSCSTPRNTVDGAMGCAAVEARKTVEGAIGGIPVTDRSTVDGAIGGMPVRDTVPAASERTTVPGTSWMSHTHTRKRAKSNIR
jgi:hypothetical protein